MKWGLLRTIKREERQRVNEIYKNIVVTMTTDNVLNFLLQRYTRERVLFKFISHNWCAKK